MELFDVVLVNSGEKMIHVIKAIREMSGLGLKEAKDIAERTPGLLATSIDPEAAEAIRQKLEAVGAVVQIRPTGQSGGDVAQGPLDELTQVGALNLDEHKAAMLKIGQRPLSEGDELIRLLKGLHDLYKAGALTESEFNAKKWAILSKD